MSVEQQPVSNKRSISADKTIDEKVETTHNGAAATTVNPAEILRKMDLHLIPMLTLLYLLSYLDRSNIGNAKIQGMAQDLDLTGSEYSLCATVFVFVYSTFEIPAPLLLKRFKPSVWLPSIMVAWGIVMTLTGLTQSYHGLLVSRIFLGVTESGLYPGVAYYLTTWYCTEELAFRQGVFFSAASMAGAFSGLFAYAISKMDGVGGLAGWRWIFILEGLLTVIVAILAFFVLHDYPGTASFLTPDERAWVMQRLKYQGSENSGRAVAQSNHFEWKYVARVVSDWQLYVGLFMYWGIVCPMASVQFFLPTIINDLGFQSTTAQLLTIPAYVTASIVAIFSCWLSDNAVKKGSERCIFVFVPMLAILIGYIIAIAGSAATGVPGVVYAGIFIAVCGIYPAYPQNLTWIANNLAGSYKRAAAMGFQIGVGGLGGASAVFFYRDKDKPQYLLGHGLEIGVVVMGLVAVVALKLNYARINRNRERSTALNVLTDEELSDLGDKSPSFRHVL